MVETGTVEIGMFFYTGDITGRYLRSQMRSAMVYLLQMTR